MKTYFRAPAPALPASVTFSTRSALPNQVRSTKNSTLRPIDFPYQAKNSSQPRISFIFPSYCLPPLPEDCNDLPLILSRFSFHHFLYVPCRKPPPGLGVVKHAVLLLLLPSQLHSQPPSYPQPHLQPHPQPRPPPSSPLPPLFCLFILNRTGANPLFATVYFRFQV